MAKIVVTGAGGGLGGQFLRYLAGRHEVIGFDVRTAPGVLAFDLAAQQPPETRKVDAVVHAAALVDPVACEADPVAAAQVNVVGTLKMLEFARKNNAKEFVFISTGSIYAASKEQKTTASPIAATRVYELTKKIGEDLTNYYSKYLSTAVLRCFFPYGPQTRKDRLISRLIRNISQGKPVELNKNALPKVNPIYVNDLCRLVEACIEKEISGTFNAGGAEVVDMKELAEIIGRVLGKKPVFKQTGIDSPNYYCDPQPVFNATGIKPEYSLEEGIRKTIEMELNKNA